MTNVTNSASTVSLFLPVMASNLGGSIITAAPSATVYAISCITQTGACAATTCALNNQTLTVTEGPSTVAYTWTDNDRASIMTSGGSIQHPLTTVNCQIGGNTSTVCTGMWKTGSTVGTQITTLTRGQVTYVPVAITGDAAMNGTYMTSNPTSGTTKATGLHTGSTSGSGSKVSGSAVGTASSGAAMMKAVVGYGAGIAAGIGAVALL
ncbi:hypothetical protein LTR62_005595 [Meristemomyces frigidus]|uniref:Ig-like domain-containing protein n=1 Tax=Meristemomyces frigidus TaxID=1508187 RepID=A0AAN7TCY4_9PEZI|nr:hypothetical protein LTR62_005595 [Meristemomyces frigidus]